MKEMREVENFGMTSHILKSGDLKMVKVRRGKRGHRQSRSLVFRISRSSKPISDDSGIRSCSTDEENTNGVGEQTQLPPRELKIRIPKSVLHGETVKKETNVIESLSPEHTVLQSNYKVHENTHDKDVLDSRRDTSNASVDDLNLDLIPNRSILCNNSEILHTDSKETKNRIVETKSTELRRSSRRIVLRVQKDYQPNFCVKESSNCTQKFSFGSSNNDQVSLGEKRKRGRKPGFRITECKKRKYVRRGRPPKLSYPKQMSLVKPVISEGGHNEKLVLVAPPKNSVWTLVPKELFESDFFKSQLLQVRLPNSSEESIKRNFVPVSFSSPVIPTSQASGRKQVKIPLINVSNTPTVRERPPEERDPKRPTVIYFKTEKKKLDCSHDLRREFRNPQHQPHNEVSRAQNDMSYLFNKYRMLEDVILKNYYELAGGNLDEADSMLSNFLTNSTDISPEEKLPSICESQGKLSNCSVFDLSLPDQASRHNGDWLLRSSEVPVDDVDTLSRKIIVQSLRILYNEEAVLA